MIHFLNISRTIAHRLSENRPQEYPSIFVGVLRVRWDQEYVALFLGKNGTKPPAVEPYEITRTSFFDMLIHTVSNLKHCRGESFGHTPVAPSALATSGPRPTLYARPKAASIATHFPTANKPLTPCLSASDFAVCQNSSSAFMALIFDS